MTQTQPGHPQPGRRTPDAPNHARCSPTGPRRGRPDPPITARRPTGHAGRRLGAAVGLLIDRAAGEPPARLHPVAAFGQAMSALERPLWRDRRLAGAFYTALGVAGGSAAMAVPAGLLRLLADTGGCWTGRALGVAGPTWVVVAGRSLGQEATRIGTALGDGDLERARQLLPALVGRDPSALDEVGIARAVVESVAENTVDAIVAPALWAAALGAPGAGGYRALNTLDAMVGHHTERYGRFGWSAARLDDVANWLPARATALLVAAVRPRSAAAVLDVLRHPPEHRSPNAAISEGAFAAALDVTLGGDAVYAGRVDARPIFGSGHPPTAADITAAVRLSRDLTLALATTLAATALPSVRVLRSR